MERQRMLLRIETESDMSIKDEAIWWDKSITLVEGCTPVSAGCAHCWSAGVTNRFHGKKGLTTNGHFNGKIICRKDRLHELTKGGAPKRIVIWNDLFHKDVPVDFIADVIIAARNSRHDYLILTKRPENALKLCNDLLSIGPSEFVKVLSQKVWVGTTVENCDCKRRIDFLRKIPAAVRFLSIEPCLEYMNRLNLDGIHWVIIGAESGNQARYCDINNIRVVVRQCQDKGIPVFVKQIHLDGKAKAIKDINLFPVDLQIRE